MHAELVTERVVLVIGHAGLEAGGRAAAADLESVEPLPVREVVVVDAGTVAGGLVA